MLEDVDDPHVPALLFKLWLHKLIDPLLSLEAVLPCVLHP